jgi:hypothetical protein
MQDITTRKSTQRGLRVIVRRLKVPAVLLNNAIASELELKQIFVIKVVDADQ